MPADVRVYLDKLVSSFEMSRDQADCVYKEYLGIRDNYLAGKLDKSALKSMSTIRTELQKSRRESKDLLGIEDMVLLTIAKKICDVKS